MYNVIRLIGDNMMDIEVLDLLNEQKQDKNNTRISIMLNVVKLDMYIMILGIIVLTIIFIIDKIIK